MNLENAMLRNCIKSNARSKSKKTKKNPEKILQDAAIKFLQTQNYYVMRLNSSTIQSMDTGIYMSSYKIAGLGSSGASDLIVGKNGKIIFIEMKSPSGRQSQSQKRFQTFVEKLGFRYLIIKDLDTLIEYERQNKSYFHVEFAKIK